MLRILFQPKYFIGTLLALFAVALTGRLGFWQLDRLEQRQTGNVVRAEQRTADPATLPLAALPDTGWFERPVEAVGRFAAEPVFVLANRSHMGQGGIEVVSPFQLENGQWLLVNRGWLAQRDREKPPPVPTGLVALKGYLSVVADDFDAQPPGMTESMWLRLDAERMGRALEAAHGNFASGSVLPYGMVLTEPHPGDVVPTPRPLSELDNGAHFSYAVQWFFMAAVFAFGWPLFLWRESRRQSAPAAPGSPSVAG